MRYAHSAILLLLTSCGGFPWIAVSDGEWDDTKKCAEKRSKWCLDGDEDGYGGLDRVPPPEGICEDNESSFNKGSGWDTSAGPYIYEEQWYYTDCNDCNDRNPDINPGAQDCRDDGDGADNDCSGVEDDQEKQDPCYVDADGDGSYTNMPACSSECMTDESLPDGANTDECNDGDATVYPGAEDQICADGQDSDCSGGSECAVVGNNVAISGASRKIDHVASVAMREIDINSDGYEDLAVVRDVSWVDDDYDVMILSGSDDAMVQGSTSVEVGASCALTRDAAWAPQIAASGDLILVSDPSAVSSRNLFAVDLNATTGCALWTTATDVDDVTQVGAALAVGTSQSIAVSRKCDDTPDGNYLRVYGLQIVSDNPDSHERYAFSPKVVGSDLDDKFSCLDDDPDDDSKPESFEDYKGLYLAEPTYARLFDDHSLDDLVVRWRSAEVGDVAVDEAVAVIASGTFAISEGEDLYSEPGACSLDSESGLAVGVAGCPDSPAQGTTSVNDPTTYVSPQDCLIVGTIASNGNTLSLYSSDGSDCVAPLSITITGPSTDADFGSSLSGAGDVNGDGYDDLLVGSTGAAYLYLRWENADGDVGYGTPYGPDGTPTSDPYATITDSSTEDEPYEVYGDADLNGDGYGDFGVLVDGTLYLFAGGPP